jgi:hypothetical protein
MLVPGATLAPGTYVFKLLDSPVNRHVVQIFEKDGDKLVATTHAMPTKRLDPKGDVVLKLNPTQGGLAAIKAWFYPGSLYGHEFVYPDAEARGIAQRTKTLVLSGDVPDSDMQSGTLYVYDANGTRRAWQADDATTKEWEGWTADRRRAVARLAQPGDRRSRESTAPIIDSQPIGMTVSVGDLEDDPMRYVSQTINVTAEVEDVFGPRLFKIDEFDWADLDGEILVYLPTNFAALVRDDDRVTITGTMRKFTGGELEQTLAWLNRRGEATVGFTDRPVLEASRIVGGDSNAALVIEVVPKSEAEHPVGTSGTVGSGERAPIGDASALGRGDESLVGRRIARSRQSRPRGRRAWILDRHRRG